jgi:hypothetical protein
MELRVACLRYGVSEVVTTTRADGLEVRLRTSGLTPEFVRVLQLRYGARCFDPSTQEVTVTLPEHVTSATPVTALLHELWSQAPSVA